MNRPIWQRLGAVLCFLLFICCFGFRITVEAVFTEGVVIGGTMAATEAALGEATTVAIGSSGLTDQLRDAADEAGQSVQAFINDRIAAYNAVASGSTLLPVMAVDLMRSLTYTPDGKLIFSEEFAGAFSSFMDWLVGEGDISVPVNSTVVASGSNAVIPYPVEISEGQSFTVIDSNNYTQYFASSNLVKCAIIRQSGGGRYIVLFASQSAFTYGNASNNSSPVLNNTSNTKYLNNNTYYTGYFAAAGFTSSDYPVIEISTNPTGYATTYWNDFCYEMVYGATSTGATDGLDVWNDADDEGVVVDPTSLLGDALAGLQGAIANVGDYISTLADVIAGVQNPALPVVGVGDIPISIPADITIPINPAIPADRVDDVPVAGDDTMPPYTGTGDYTLPLADFFPFCIPFDIYKMLSLLSASPVAPSVDYPFPLPGGGTYTIHIDLSQFDSVAQVLRTIETLAFCVGLGFVTKKLLFGS